MLKMQYMSLFIIIFQKGKYINEKKDRVMVMHIENFTKPLYQVFPTDLYFINFSFNKSFFSPLVVLIMS